VQLSLSLVRSIFGKNYGWNARTWMFGWLGTGFHARQHYVDQHIRFWEWTGHWVFRGFFLVLISSRFFLIFTRSICSFPWLSLTIFASFAQEKRKKRCTLPLPSPSYVLYSISYLSGKPRFERPSLPFTTPLLTLHTFILL
jgi:hypothetical protein